MFKFSISFLALLAIFRVHAEEIIIEIPDNLFPENTKITANFDGSINIFSPKLYFHDDYYPITNTNETSAGVCSLLNRDWVESTVERIKDVNNYENTYRFIIIDKIGKFVSSYTQNCYESCYILDRVTCSPKYENS